jgi:hypothetical protein
MTSKVNEAISEFGYPSVNFGIQNRHSAGGVNMEPGHPPHTHCFCQSAGGTGDVRCCGCGKIKKAREG